MRSKSRTRRVISTTPTAELQAVPVTAALSPEPAGDGGHRSERTGTTAAGTVSRGARPTAGGDPDVAAPRRFARRASSTRCNMIVCPRGPLAALRPRCSIPPRIGTRPRYTDKRVASGGDTPGRARDTFRERAQHEAARYGSDEWIFVRELLQNARDAGASRVDWTIAELGDDVVVACSDDGEGMDLEHARQYLFSLYTSSKEETSDQIGCFGVGFWSILRFAPHRIAIASCKAGGAPWAIELDGELRGAKQRAGTEPRGTTVTLVRPGRAEVVTAQIRRAARENARFLTRRGADERPLPIRINGVLINTAFELSAPSSQFRRGRLRGVVSLGKVPRVELLSGGLLVRSAVDLDEIENKDVPSSSTPSANLPGGASPVVLLDSPSLELLLARRDARQTKSLRRLVRLARRELRWLVAQQIDRSRPPSLFERLRSWSSHLLRDNPRGQFAVGLIASAGLGFLALKPVLEPPLAEPPPVIVGRPPPAEPVYRDLSAGYHGPAVSPIAATSSEDAIELRYHPATETKYLRVLALDHVETAERGAIGGAPYRSTPCRSECTSIELRFAAPAGYMRIPVPTGERVDAKTVRVDGRAAQVYRSTLDEPAIYLPQAGSGVLSYATSPASPVDVAFERDTMALPSDLKRRARRLSRRSIGDRVARLRTLAQSRVAYRTDLETTTAHREARAAGTPFVTRTLEIGAGDCDVQNGLLVALLRAAKVQARLAIGYVGRSGRPHPGLHAWVEYRTKNGPWQVADASETPIDRAARQGAASSPIATRPAGPLHTTPRVATARPTAGPATPQRQAKRPSAAAIDEEPPRSSVAARLEALPPTELGSTTEVDRPTSATMSPPAATSAPPPAPSWWKTTTMGLATGLLALGGMWQWRRRTTRDVTLDDHTDISAMLTGALQRPELFRDLPAVMDRPLIPLLQRGAISLRDAMRRADAHRLYCATASGDLTEHTAVLDADTPEGSAVAQALAATDLDRWRTWLAQAQAGPLIARCTELLREQGERWLIKTSAALQRPVEMLDLGELGQRRRAYDRVVLVANDDARVQVLQRQWHREPAAAAFGFADHILTHLDLSDARRQHLLAVAASAAIDEATK
ncbi:MAG: hypothetical protein B7733_23920 [Myxococcales bacterium FL481]|nr:MAG: hypothetical protein B7733_23920 [Myxococcales bacterium FL481]